MERSKDAHVSMTPKATIGSGRMPLLYGNQKARNINAAVQWATRRPLTSSPKRGRISRDSTNQIMSAATSDGRRMKTEEVDTCVSAARRS